MDPSILNSEATVNDPFRRPRPDAIRRIQQIDHVILKHELRWMTMLLSKVNREERSASVEELSDVFLALRDHLESHLKKEDSQLFPALQSYMSNRPKVSIEKICSLIAELKADHCIVVEYLRALSRSSGELQVPALMDARLRLFLLQQERFARTVTTHLLDEEGTTFDAFLASVKKEGSSNDAESEAEEDVHK